MNHDLNEEYKMVESLTKIFSVYGFDSRKKYSKEEVDRLFEEYFKTRSLKIKNELIEANIGLAIKCAMDLVKKLKTIDLEDLASVGFEHLGEIIERYNPEKGIFSSYATKSLNGYMLDELGILMFAPHISFKSREENTKITRAIKEYEEKYGERPNIKYLADKTGFSPEKIVNLIGSTSIPEKLDKKDLLTPDSSEKVLNKTTIDYLLKALDKCLNERQKQVIVLRFGLNGNKPHILSEIGEALGITREGARQLEKRALKKLKDYFKEEQISFDVPLPELLDSAEIDTSQIMDNSSVDNYNSSYKDYDGYSKEEFENKGIGLK